MAAAGASRGVEIARSLLRCPSVTPADAGALEAVTDVLRPLGFVCHELSFGDDPTIPNLYARLGESRPVFCFAGHTDVVPPGAEGAWRHGPFEAALDEGRLWGRGAVDMKGGIAAFLAALERHLESVEGGRPHGSIALLVTGDEEGPALHGTKAVVEWLQARGEHLDACVVGEPTSQAEVGDTLKVGRRGSLTGRLSVTGRQGHAAYPHLADNPVHKLLPLLAALIEPPLDTGTARFEPSSLQITTVDVGNPASNVIPAEAKAVFNSRFNDTFSSGTLERELRRRLAATGVEGWSLAIEVSGESFVTEGGALLGAVEAAVETVTGRRPEISTGGGTSDARFIKDLCPVLELGLVGATMHQVDESTPIADIETLTLIYESVLERFFAS